MQKKKSIFHCKFCDYTCSTKFLWNQHCATQKHIRKQMETSTYSLHNKPKKYAPPTTSVDKQIKCVCGKIFGTRAGLWKHKQKCEKQLSSTNDISYNNQTGVLNKNNLQKENIELKDLVHKMLIEINNEAKAKDQIIGQLEKQNQIIKEMIPRLGNNNNNRFNINVFLNEDCRDAINMNEFLESLQVKLTDLQYTQNNGLIEGISSVLVDGLKQLDTCKRPIHCTDIKREVLYIKNNDEWGRGNTKQHLRSAIVDVANKQRKAIAEWEMNNPEWSKSEKGKEDYIKLVKSVMSDIDEPTTENIIIKNIAKETIIHKQPNKE